MAVLRLTLDEGRDPVDGSELNAVRRRALELLERDEDDLSDVEMMQRSTDQFWFVDLCLEQLHRLPSEVEPLMTCREYTLLQAHGIVKRAMSEMTTRFRGSKAPTM